MPVTLTEDEAAALERYIRIHGFNYTEGGTIGVILLKCIHRGGNARPVDAIPSDHPNL